MNVLAAWQNELHRRRIVIRKRVPCAASVEHVEAVLTCSPLEAGLGEADLGAASVLR
jgi:hypothetical protein